MNHEKAVIAKSNAFWTRIDRREVDECWIWKASLDRDGYGSFQFRFHGKKTKVRAHRAAYILAGHDLNEDDVLRHTCDTPACVNDRHLVLGTHIDNIRDRDSKGRQAAGERNGRAKLTSAQVNEIRNALQAGYSIYDLGRRFKVDPRTIRSISKGETWKKVEA